MKVEGMTPLEIARKREESESCVNCANCVKVRRAYFCGANGKFLIPRFMDIGRCMHVPSDFRKREGDNES